MIPTILKLCGYSGYCRKYRGAMEAWTDKENRQSIGDATAQIDDICTQCGRIFENCHKQRGVRV
ncbi:hypothetical protein CMI37_17480 [Candidatus Pacearchaeota archaeon]|nr:hypothetical protein [Candidatus Pacearchaeota archaeon]|tara:strand:- start:366 stop:557 length:192 start_codon:yes stop_codon:yes gene_type:complete